MRVAIIGGGAAGFFAAIATKENYPNAEVTIYEKSTKVLAKVKISGGGRCNVTHACFQVNDLIKYYPRKEGMRRETFHEIYFVDFMRKTLLLFREVHSLNHIVKALLYYCVLVLKIDI